MRQMGSAGRKHGSPFALALGIALLGYVPAADARIRSIILNPPTVPFDLFGTTSFGSVGPYMLIDGVAIGEIDPRDPLNAVIQDIRLAPQSYFTCVHRDSVQ
jgi:hypothetical protein